MAAHGSLDSEKEKTRAVVKVTDPGFPFDYDDYGKVWNRCLHTANEGDGAGWLDLLKNFFWLTHIFCLHCTQRLLNLPRMQATKRSRHLVTVELGQHLWNRVEQIAQSQQRTRANVCRLIISQALTQCPTNDTKTPSKQTKP